MKKLFYFILGLSVFVLMFGTHQASSTQLRSMQTIGESAIHIYLSANQNIDSTTPTKVLFDQELYDDNNEFASYKFTTKEDGVYVVSCGILIDDLDDGDKVNLYIYKNGSGVSMTSSDSPADALNIFLSLSANLKLVTDDYVEVYAYHNEGATQVLLSGGDPRFNWLTITKVGNR